MLSEMLVLILLLISSICTVHTLSLRAASTVPAGVVDVVVIGAGIGGLSAAGILSAKYGQHCAVFEAHSRIGGCAHSFPITSKKSRTNYEFDSGPTITLGCSGAPFNPLMQILRSLGAGSSLDWIKYEAWGMVTEAGAWPFELGPDKFERGPLSRFGGPAALREFAELREACAPLCAGAAGIPTMSLRADAFRLLPLLPHLDALKKVIPYADVLNGNFGPFIDKHVKDAWLLSWLDALAFSLSGLDARSTGAATMAYTLYDLHRAGAALDYPRGGFGKIGEAFADIIRSTGSEIHVSSPVEEIVVERGRAIGVKLKTGHFVRAKRGIICNANIWSLPRLLQSSQANLDDTQRRDLIEAPQRVAKTKSFMHLHMGIDSTGLDVSKMHAHFTVMDKGLHTGTSPCADRNMVAVSNPSVLDSSLVDKPNRLLLHAYGAGNEPWAPEWSNIKDEVQLSEAKQKGSAFLFRSISRALGISERELSERQDVALVGSPLTHRRFLAREEGTYGAEFGSMLASPVTSLPGLFLAGDSVFPGIGVPAVAVSGANAANTMVSVARHLLTGTR